MSTDERYSLQGYFYDNLQPIVYDISLFINCSCVYSKLSVISAPSHYILSLFVVVIHAFFLIRLLKYIYRFIGEESSEHGKGLTNEPTWMIDPIDGTTNFVHGFPFSAVSIGFAIDKVPVVGVVYNFNLKQLYAAKKGGGATLNNKPIHASKCTGKACPGF